MNYIVRNNCLMSLAINLSLELNYISFNNILNLWDLFKKSSDFPVVVLRLLNNKYDKQL